MRRSFLSGALLLLAGGAYAASQITGYVQINPPNSPQPGGFNTQSGTVGTFTDTGLAPNQCVQTTAGGLLTTSGLQCGAGGGGPSGASLLQVTQSGVQITSPTSSMNFAGPPFLLSAIGSTATITLNPSSVTLQGNNLSATYLSNSSATATYLQQTNAAATYLTQASAAANYLLQSVAGITYAPILGSANYIQNNNGLQSPASFNITGSNKITDTTSSGTGLTITESGSSSNGLSIAQTGSSGSGATVTCTSPDTTSCTAVTGTANGSAATGGTQQTGVSGVASGIQSSVGLQGQGTGSGINYGAFITASGGAANHALGLGSGDLFTSGSAGTSGQVLTSQGSGTVPHWATGSGGSTTVISSGIAFGSSTNTITADTTSLTWTDSSQQLTVTSTQPWPGGISFSKPMLNLVGNAASGIKRYCLNLGDATSSTRNLICRDAANGNDFSFGTEGVPGGAYAPAMTITGNTLQANTFNTSSATITGVGNGQISLTISGSSNTVVSSSNSSIVGGYLIYTSTNYQVGTSTGTGGTGGGSGTPATPFNSVQYNNAGAFGGSNNFQFNGTSVTIASSVTIHDFPSANSIGYVDIFKNSAVVDVPLLTIGSTGNSNQFTVRNQDTVQMNATGANIGNLQIGGRADGDAVGDPYSLTEIPNTSGTQGVKIYDTSGNLDIGTSRTGSGGTNGSINFNIAGGGLGNGSGTNEVVISSFGVTMTTMTNITIGAGVQTSLGGALNITTSNSAWNEPGIYINATANTSNNNSDILIDDGFTPALTWRETSQSNPSAKKWQISAHQGVMRFENRLNDDSGFGPFMQVSSATFWNDMYVGSVYGNQNNNTQFQIQSSTGNVYITNQSTAGTGGYRVDVSTIGHFNVVNSSTSFGPTITNGTGDTSCSDTACTITATNSPVTFTFTKAYTKVPVCVYSERTGSVVNAASYTLTATAFTLTQTGLGGDTIDLICVGRD